MNPMDPMPNWLGTATYARLCGAADPTAVAEAICEWWDKLHPKGQGESPSDYADLIRKIEELSR